MSIRAGMHHLFGEHDKALVRQSVDAAMSDPLSAARATARLLLDACDNDAERTAVRKMLDATLTHFDRHLVLLDASQGGGGAPGGGS